MILYFLILVIGVWLGLKIGKREEMDAPILGAVMGILIAVMVLSVITLIFIGTIHRHQQYTEYEKVEIVALKNSESIQGQFFLLSGHIESIPYYFFYYKLPDGGKKLGKVVAEEATIYEEKRANAYMVKTGTTTIYEKSKRWMIWLLLPEFLSPGDETHFTGYAVHVPEGTVKRDINLDLKDLK